MFSELHGSTSTIILEPAQALTTLILFCQKLITFNNHFLTNCSEPLISGVDLPNAVFPVDSIPGFLNSCLQSHFKVHI